uniref:Lysophospholipase n=1 Tax=Nonomuraea gerenzanensis TaxID=93944 RepID=A0A1M4DWN8_9ACTN|nr:Lysophospholipase [Nonomuraea gerenzanensis]
MLVTGFSQGGHAAMALGKALRGDPAYRLRGVAPISGPYHVRAAELPALLQDRLDPHSATFYLAYGTVSMNRLHHFYGSPSEVFRDPAVEQLFDGGPQLRADRGRAAGLAARSRHRRLPGADHQTVGGVAAGDEGEGRDVRGVASRGAGAAVRGAW